MAIEILNHQYIAHPRAKEKLREGRLSSDGFPLHEKSDQSFKGIEFPQGLTKKIVKNNKVENALKGTIVNKFLKSASENPGLYEALVSFLITCSLRPISIMVVPGAKKEDKEYAAAQSIASGTVGLAFSYMLYKPIEKALNSILFDVNSKNVNTALNGLYVNHKSLVEELAAFGILPKELPTDKSKDNLFKFINNSMSEKNVSDSVLEILTGKDKTKSGKLSSVIDKFKKALDTEFAKVKMTEVAKTKEYLVYKTLDFTEGKLKTVLSPAADKANFALNYGSKFLLAPVLAFAMIGSIPFVMKKLFPKHKKGGKDKAAEAPKQNSLTDERNIIFSKSLKTSGVSFSDFASKASNQTAAPASVSFTGIGTATKGLEKAYDAVYSTPFSKVFKKIFEKIAYSEMFSAKMKDLMNPNKIKKAGKLVTEYDKKGEVVKKADRHFLLSNFPAIVACWMSGFYIFNTIRNKKIESERKPTLCINMTLVAIFSTFAGKVIEKFFEPLKNALMDKHKAVMAGKLSYDVKNAWKQAYSLLIFTLAFRYLGPVIATPMADKLTKFLQQNGILKDPSKKHEENKPEKTEVKK